MKRDILRHVPNAILAVLVVGTSIVYLGPKAASVLPRPAERPRIEPSTRTEPGRCPDITREKQVCQFDEAGKLIMIGDSDLELFMEPLPDAGDYKLIFPDGRIWAKGMGGRASVVTVKSPNGQRTITYWLQ